METVKDEVKRMLDESDALDRIPSKLWAVAFYLAREIDKIKQQSYENNT